MELVLLPYDLSVCKLLSIADIDLRKDFLFIGKTDEELSLVCQTSDVPASVTDREDGWKGFRIKGVLDFSLIGIISKISGVLAKNQIGIFVVSTYNTDYVLVKEEQLNEALTALAAEGYSIV